MYAPGSLLFVYCVLIIMASVAGGRLPTLIRMTHLRTQLLISGVGGLMLGIAMLHLLPHAGEILGSTSQTGVAALVGLIVMFLLIRLFHTHEHGPHEHTSAEQGHAEHEHEHEHDHGDTHEL